MTPKKSEVTPPTGRLLPDGWRVIWADPTMYLKLAPDCQMTKLHIFQNGTMVITIKRPAGICGERNKD